MFSIENLYYILYVNLFKRIKCDLNYFYKFGSTSPEHVGRNFLSEQSLIQSGTDAFFYDQEPVRPEVVNELIGKFLLFSSAKQKKRIFITSEQSDFVKTLCKTYNFYHLYYFFHGFASLYWYKDCQFFTNNKPGFQSRFLSFNRLCIKDRIYRLLLVSNLIERNIFSKGSISLQLINSGENIVKKEILDPNCRLSKKSKIKVFNNLSKCKKNFVVDKENISGESSAHLGPEEYTLWQSYFLHVVSETVFFDQKLHLTEKIFKPIVSRRPFILLGAYKNLEYLKSYGFKTFDKWIDESYDNEPDNEKRLMMVCDEVEKIANLSEDKIEEMYWDMQEVLDYNYQHFYTDFKQIIVNELVDNFEGYMRWHNNGRLNDEVYDIESLNLPEVKKLLAQ